MEKKETLSEEVKEFNPEAFAGLDALVEKVNEGESSEEPSNLVSDSKDVDQSEKEHVNVLEENDDDDESDFDWNLNEEEEEQTEEEVLKEAENNDDWDSTEEDSEEEDSEEDKENKENKEDEGVDWGSVAEELGLEGSSKEDIINAIKSKKDPAEVNDTVTKYQGYLKLTDRELLAADMKGSGMDEYDADESLDRMEDSGVLKHEALKIRKQLNSAIRNEKVSIQESKEKEVSSKAESQEQARKDLQTELKGFKNYLGGKVTVEQRKDLYKYITNGNFNKDIYESHANVAEAAFLWKNRSQIQKMLKSQGFEDGKGSVLDNLSNRGSRGNSKPKYKAGSGFDASAFMGE
mgnify:FL=1|tara:strand:- start:549 stop:1595 length:1047 start_codon:yes stop_codon:yes gene_type:complete